MDRAQPDSDPEARRAGRAQAHPECGTPISCHAPGRGATRACRAERTRRARCPKPARGPPSAAHCSVRQALPRPPAARDPGPAACRHTAPSVRHRHRLAARPERHTGLPSRRTRAKATRRQRSSHRSGRRLSSGCLPSVRSRPSLRSPTGLRGAALPPAPSREWDAAVPARRDEREQRYTGAQMRKAHQHEAGGLFKRSPAVSYSPTRSPSQYHRR